MNAVLIHIGFVCSVCKTSNNTNSKYFPWNEQYRFFNRQMVNLTLKVTILLFIFDKFDTTK